MSSVNKAIIVGSVGKDPEIRNTQDGRKIASLSIATSEKWKDRQSGERKEKTEWHKVSVLSEGLVSVVESYVKKGSKLYVQGQIETRKWQDKDGNDIYSTEIVLKGYGAELVLLNRVDGEQSDYAPTPHETSKANAYQPTPVDLDDEIPF